MTATEAPEHDGKNPFAKRVLTREDVSPEDVEERGGVSAEDVEEHATEAPPPDAEKERKRIEFAAKMAAGRAATVCYENPAE